jgi:LacI family transcriptional regulator
MGYRPDPMLSALNFYRTSQDQAKAQPSIAFLMRSRSRRSPNTFFADDQFLKGALRACERLGYRLVPFQIVTTGPEGPRLSRIMRSRGIGGVIMAALDINLRALDLEWDHFSALCIESHHLGLSLHTVGNNQTAITRLAVRRMAELGYRRIGLAVGTVEEASLGKPFGAGYMVEVHEHPDLTQIPTLLLRSNDEPTMSLWLHSWIKRNRIDAVLSNWSNMPDLLKAAGFVIPRDLGLATLDYNPNRGAAAGIRQSHQIVGERAVEGLALLMKTNQRGKIRLPNMTFVDGSWEDGPELPPRTALRQK